MRARALAIEALEALEVRGATPAGRQLSELRRQQGEARRRAERLAMHGGGGGGGGGLAAEGAAAALAAGREERAADASSWRAALECVAGGPEALDGRDAAPDVVPRLTALALELASPRGFGVGERRTPASRTV